MKTQPWFVAMVLVLTALFTAGAMAAPKQGAGKGRAGLKLLDVVSGALAKVEGLSEEQKNKTTEIVTEAETQLTALRDEARSQGEGADRKAIRTKAQEIVNAAKTSIEAELTEEQKASFRTALADARAEAAAEREAKGGGKGKGKK